MMVSTKGRYALRVLIDLAEHQTDGYIPLKDTAARQEISEKYLEGIIKILVKAKLLEGVRGKGGGYRLTKAPEQYTVGSILRLTENSMAPVACLEPGSTDCPRMGSCKTLPLWQGLDKVVNEYLDGVTIADLVQNGQPGDDYVISELFLRTATTSCRSASRLRRIIFRAWFPLSSRENALGDRRHLFEPKASCAD